jgi:hypothetical protein
VLANDHREYEEKVERHRAERDELHLEKQQVHADKLPQGTAASAAGY